MDDKTPRKIEPMPIEYLDPNPFQVRVIDEAGLAGLVQSIERYGFVGSLEARTNPWNPMGRKQLVYGHRRKRAAELAGLKTVPLRTVEYTDEQMRELAYVENGTVEPLSYWDEAVHFKRLSDAGMSMTQIATTIGKSKGYVQGRLDVLRLPEGPIKEAAKANQIEMTVCNVLLTMEEAEREHLFESVKKGEMTASELRAIRSAIGNKTFVPDGSSTGEDGRSVFTILKPEVAKLPQLVKEPLVVPERFGPVGLDIDKDPELPMPPAEGIMRGIRIPDVTVISPKTGRDWAERVLNQMRGVVPILENNAAKADFTTLSPAEAHELKDLRDKAAEILSVPELVVV